MFLPTTSHLTLRPWAVLCVRRNMSKMDVTGYSADRRTRLTSLLTALGTYVANGLVGSQMHLANIFNRYLSTD